MVSKSANRIGDLSDRLDQVQEWLQPLAKNIPNASDLEGYLPNQKPKRGIALPILIAIGGLALIGGLTFLSGASQNRQTANLQNKLRSEPSEEIPVESSSEDRIQVNDLEPLSKNK